MWLSQVPSSVPELMGCLLVTVLSSPVSSTQWPFLIASNGQFLVEESGDSDVPMQEGVAGSKDIGPEVGAQPDRKEDGDWSGMSKGGKIWDVGVDRHDGANQPQDTEAEEGEEEEDKHVLYTGAP